MAMFWPGLRSLAVRPGIMEKGLKGMLSVVNLEIRGFGQRYVG